MNKLLMSILLLSSLAFCDNDTFNKLTCFSKSDFAFKNAHYGKVGADILLRFFSKIDGELYTDTLNVRHKIILDHIKGNDLWDSILNKCIGSVEVWSCELPYFMSKEMPKYAVFFKFEDEKITARLTDYNIDNGYFILNYDTKTYRMNFSEEGKEKLKSFFQKILSGIPNDIDNHDWKKIYPH